jgi:hypothetical protein
MLGSASSAPQAILLSWGEKKRKKSYIYSDKVIIKTSEWANGKYIKDKNQFTPMIQIQLCEAV